MNCVVPEPIGTAGLLTASHALLRLTRSPAVNRSPPPVPGYSANTPSVPFSSPIPSTRHSLNIPSVPFSSPGCDSVSGFHRGFFCCGPLRRTGAGCASLARHSAALSVLPHTS